jgi:hypothetical protein
MRFFMRVVNAPVVPHDRSAEVVSPVFNGAIDSRRRRPLIGSLANHNAIGPTDLRRSASAGCAWLVVSNRSLPTGQRRRNKVHRLRTPSSTQPRRNRQ